MALEIWPEVLETAKDRIDLDDIARSAAGDAANADEARDLADQRVETAVRHVLDGDVPEDRAHLVDDAVDELVWQGGRKAVKWWTHENADELRD